MNYQPIFYHSKSQYSRNQEGFGLVTVLSIGMIASLVIAGLLSGVLSVSRTLGSDKSAFNVQNSAEAASDYVLARLNNSATSSDFDLSSGSKTVLINKDTTGLPCQLDSSVTVSNSFPPNTSRLFDPKLSLYDPNDNERDPLKPTQKWSLFANAGKSWRILTSTCKSGTISKTVVVVAKANIPGWRPPTNMSSATTYFPSAALGTNSVQLSDFATTRGYSSSEGTYFAATDNPAKALGGDVTAFSQVTIPGKNVEIGGSLTVPSIKAPGNLSADGSANEQSLKVNRYVTVNQGENGFANTFQGDDFSNVLGLASASFPSLNSPDAYIQTNANQSQTVLPPAPIAPRNNDGSLANSVTYTTDATQANLVAGDNAVSTLKISSDIPMVQPTRIFVENDVATNTVVSLKGNVNSNGAPANLQIWYNGNGVINIDARDVRATIYAPFATVNVFGQNTSNNGSDHFRGAIVARNLHLSNIVFDMDQSTTVNGSGGIGTLQFNKIDILNSVRYTAVSYFSRKN